MPLSGTTLDNGQGLVLGNILSLRRYIDNLPTGATVTKAWLMVKTAYSVLDASATISKSITTSNVAGTGQIEDDGTTDQAAILRFDLTNTDTTAVSADTTYVYAIKYLLSDGQAIDLEIGTATWKNYVVRAVS